MPKIKTNRTKPPPEGYEEIEQVLEEYARKMRDGQSSHIDYNFDTTPHHGEEGQLRDKRRWSIHGEAWG